MTSNSPRNMSDWMRIQERSAVNLRGLASTIRSSVLVIKEEVDEISGRQPTHPIELTFQTALYSEIDSRLRVRFLLDFPDVIKGTDGKAMAIESYELWGRDVTTSLLARTTPAVAGGAVPGLTLPGLAMTPSVRAAEEDNFRPWALLATSPESAFRAEDFTPGTLWEFKARAIGVRTTTAGRFSASVTVEMEEDTTPPPQPTAPTLTVSRGTITVRWDGQGVGGPMPADFKYAVLSHGTASSPTLEIARFGRVGGFTVVAPSGYYLPQFFRLQAVDESGNRGPWSEQAVGYTTPLVDKDIILSTIDAAKTHLINVDAGVSILPNTVITEHLVVTEEMTAALANFLHVKADMLEVNEIWADTAWFGAADAILVRSDMFVGKTFEGGQFTLTQGGKFQTSVEELRGIKITELGMSAWSQSGVRTFNLDATTAALSVFGGSITGATIQTATTGRRVVLSSAVGLMMYDAANNVVLTQDSSSGDMVMRGNILSRTVSGNSLWLGADMTESGASGVPQKPGLVFGSTTDEIQAPALYRDGAYGALRMDSPYSDNTINTARSVMMASNSGVFGYAWRSGQNSGPSVTHSAKLFLGTNDQWHVGGGRPGSTGDGRITGDSDSGVITIVRNANHLLSFEADRSTYLNTSRLDISGPVYASAKNFRIPHPTLAGKDLVHGSTESPLAGVEYWGRGVIGAGGEALVVLPEYFEALTKVQNREPYAFGRGEALNWGDIVDGTFLVYGTPGIEFGWLVKAERSGADFDIVQDSIVQPEPPQSEQVPDQTQPEPEGGYPMPVIQ